MREAIPVDLAKRAIESNLGRNLTLHELSVATHCSPWSLCRAFRRATGQTLTFYRHAIRMRVALERLTACDTDLTELALELGYSSHSHFTHVFRRHLGITPSQLRARAREKELPRPVPHEARQSAC
jgi:AraC-like DNA-binding protein